MEGDYFILGKAVRILSVESFTQPKSKELYNACMHNRSFDVIEKQVEIDTNGSLVAEYIIVDCFCGMIASRNKAKIKSRERLALCYSEKSLFPPMVFALRKDFPITVHQMSHWKYKPRILCIYLEPWFTAKRMWTPQQFLNNIVLWLMNASEETLHGHDLPLERLFFQSQYKVFLPRHFIEKVGDCQYSFVFSKIGLNSSNQILLRGEFVERVRENTFGENAPNISSLAITIPCVVQRNVIHSPDTLGKLHDYFAVQDINLGESLALEINSVLSRQYSSGVFKLDDDSQCTILCCIIGVAREYGLAPEEYHILGFVLAGGLKSLAIKLGLASRVPCLSDYSLESSIIGGTSHLKMNGEWRGIEIEQVEIRTLYTDEDARRASGIGTNYINFQATLAGVGALGSSLADIWSRAGWGNWWYIDDDVVEPHNLVRHIANHHAIGLSKVDLVKKLSIDTYLSRDTNALCDKVNNFSNQEVMHALSVSSLIVDATTSLDAPRDLAMQDGIGRCVSVFLSPSGLDSVLLVENTSRTIRLDHLEYQYYRALLDNDFGEKHLASNQKPLWAGSGCRELTTVMACDIVKMHAGLLARQVRMCTEQDDSIIKIFMYDELSGAVSIYEQKGVEVCRKLISEWTIVYDKILVEKIKQLRITALPAETGGVIVGYIDQVTRHVYIVDILRAPQDSITAKTYFERGYADLENELSKITLRTASIVCYIGEWHSHPEGVSSQASLLDTQLLELLKKEMYREGLPVVMVIVGEEEDISIHLGYEEE